MNVWIEVESNLNHKKHLEAVGEKPLETINGTIAIMNVAIEWNTTSIDRKRRKGRHGSKFGLLGEFNAIQAQFTTII